MGHVITHLCRPDPNVFLNWTAGEFRAWMNKYMALFYMDVNFT